MQLRTALGSSTTRGTEGTESISLQGQAPQVFDPDRVVFPINLVSALLVGSGDLSIAGAIRREQPAAVVRQLCNDPYTRTHNEPAWLTCPFHACVRVRMTFAFTLLNLSHASYSTHQWYHRQFAATYPASRRAMIPFVW